MYFEEMPLRCGFAVLIGEQCQNILARAIYEARAKKAAPEQKKMAAEAAILFDFEAI